MNFNFSEPYYLFLLPILLIPITQIIRKKYYGKFLFGTTENLPKVKPTARIIIAQLIPFIYLTAMILIIIALAGPETIKTERKIKHKAIAIEMLVDISSSMNSPYTNNISRLDAAKIAFISFIKQRNNDLIGLISFSGYAISRAPLTPNHKILLQLLDTLQITRDEYMSQQETLTAIGDAIITACVHLKTAKTESKIIVLITDGISNSGIVPPIKAAYIAKKLNIKIYAISINRQAGFRASLEQITKITDGETFSVSDSTKLKQALVKINQLKKSEITVNTTTFSQQYKLLFIIIALILITISVTANFYLTGRIIG